jgi:hypothetical protein
MKKKYFYRVTFIVPRVPLLLSSVLKKVVRAQPSSFNHMHTHALSVVVSKLGGTRGTRGTFEVTIRLC